MKNTIKKTLAFLVVGLAASALMCQQAEAVVIAPGSQISFSGVVNFNNANNLATATRVDHWYKPDGTGDGTAIVTAGSSGSFSGIAGGTSATFFNGYTFTPSTITPGLWSVGGFTFNLLTSTVTLQNATDLIIKGTGTIVSGTDSTSGTWDFKVSNASGQSQSVFSFAASSSAVPDGGSAVALLGLALAGVEALRRKFARK